MPLSGHYGVDLRGKSQEASLEGFLNGRSRVREPAIEGQWPSEISTHSAAAGLLTVQCAFALCATGINIEVFVRQDS